MSAIRTEALTKVYLSKHLFKTLRHSALKELTLEVSGNEIFGLLGLNGSGKTTTIKLLLGLLFPTSGSAFVFGEDVCGISTRKNIGYLPEISYYFKYLTAKEILFFYAQLSDVSEEEIGSRLQQALELVDLQDKGDVRLSEFSRGMLQRIGMAQALLHNPQLLLLDEPMSGLDPLGIIKMREVILRLKQEGKTIFFSSHIISEVEKVCDRVGILHNGVLKKIVILKDTKQPLEDIFMQTINAESV